MRHLNLKTVSTELNFSDFSFIFDLTFTQYWLTLLSHCYFQTLTDSYLIRILNYDTINAIVMPKKTNFKVATLKKHKQKKHHKAANCCIECYLHCSKPQLNRPLFFSLLHKRTYIYVIIIAVDSVPHRSDEILPATYLYVVSHPTLNFQKRIYMWLSTESVKLVA